MRRISIMLPLLLIMTALTAQPVHASTSAKPTCYRTSCTGQLPTDYDCADDAITVTIDNRFVSSPPFNGTYLYTTTVEGYGDRISVEMRYSPRCRATWSRVYSLGSHAGFHGELSTWINGQASQKSWIGYDGSGLWYTRMVDGGVQNCFGMQIYQNGVYRNWRQAYCV